MKKKAESKFDIDKIGRFLKSNFNKISSPEYTIFSIYAIFTGAIAGLAAVIFHNSIEFFNVLFFEQTAEGLFFLGTAAVIVLPAIGMLIQSLMIITAPDTAKRRGVSEVIKSTALRGGYIPFRTTIFHFFAPVICIGSGGTVGPEGPAAQLGGGVASKMGQLLGLSDNRRRMFTAAGSGAAIAAIFNTPLGGIFFALEIVLLNDFQSPTFSALILASVTASAISRLFLGNQSVFHFSIPEVTDYEHFYMFILLGIATGILSIVFIRYSSILENWFKNKILKIFPQWTVMVTVGLLVGLCGFYYKDIFGIGYIGINHILASSLTWKVVLILLAMKFILVPMVLHSGGFGGLFAPSLFIGAAFGFLFALGANALWDLNLDTTTFALVSMGAVLGGVNSIPISAILIIFEMTKNYTFILPLMLAVVISTMIVQIVMKGSIHVKHLEKEGYKISHGREASILKSISVKDVMREDVMLIPHDTPLTKLVAQLMESPHSTFYTVDKKGKLQGTITENELRPIITEYEHIRQMLVAGDIAKSEVTTVKETDDLDHVLKLFEHKIVDQFPVVSSRSNDKVIGKIFRQDVIACYNRESLKYNLADGFKRELKTINKTGISKVADGFSIAERKVKKSFVGKTLSQLQLRNKYHLEVLMIKSYVSPFSEKEDKDTFIFPDPKYIIKDQDVLVIFGADEFIVKSENWT
ncbi:chloride channel protein [Bacteroidota bacterium]